MRPLMAERRLIAPPITVCRRRFASHRPHIGRQSSPDVPPGDGN